MGGKSSKSQGGVAGAGTRPGDAASASASTTAAPRVRDSVHSTGSGDRLNLPSAGSQPLLRSGSAHSAASTGSRSPATAQASQRMRVASFSLQGFDKPALATTLPDAAASTISEGDETAGVVMRKKKKKAEGMWQENTAFTSNEDADVFPTRPDSMILFEEAEVETLDDGTTKIKGNKFSKSSSVVSTGSFASVAEGDEGADGSVQPRSGGQLASTHSPLAQSTSATSATAPASSAAAPSQAASKGQKDDLPDLSFLDEVQDIIAETTQQLNEQG